MCFWDDKLASFAYRASVLAKKLCSLLTLVLSVYMRIHIRVGWGRGISVLGV